jgi:hypothetical protein
MRKLVLIEFMSLDGVVQAPGDPQEDTEGGFAHGGWQRPYFDDAFLAAAGKGRDRRPALRPQDLRRDGGVLADPG